MDSREQTGMVAEVMVTHPTSYTPKMDSGNSADNTPTVMEVGCLEG